MMLQANETIELNRWHRHAIVICRILFDVRTFHINMEFFALGFFENGKKKFNCEMMADVLYKCEILIQGNVNAWYKIDAEFHGSL